MSDPIRQRAEAIAVDFAHDAGCQQPHGGRCRCAEDEDYTERLEAIADRFDAFGLSLGDLEKFDFRNKEIPRMVAGQMPRDLDNSVVIGMH